MTGMNGSPLYGVDDETITCRGDHHDWPVLKPGPLPPGITAARRRDGCFQVTITCRTCSRWRRKTTLPGGAYDFMAVYEYGGGPGDFSAREDTPRGKLARADYAAELYRRLAETLRETAP